MNDDIEARLRRHLAQRATGLAPGGDLADLADRLRQRHLHRQRLLGAALALSLLAGPVAGFALGRSSDDGPTSVRTATGTAAAPLVTTPPPVLPRASLGELTTEKGVAFDSTLSGAGVGGDVGPYLGLPLGRRFVRTSGDGVTIRGYEAEVAPTDFGNPFWTPPGWCFPSGFLQADVSTDEAVAVVTAPVYDELRDGEPNVLVQLAGLDEGAPMWIVLVQVPAGAASARATFPTGSVDSMEVVGGLATLAADAPVPDGDDPSGVFDAEVVVDALDATGAVLSSQRVSASSMYGNLKVAYGPPAPECEVPPPALPPPGEQPADPESANAGVRQAFADAYLGTNPDEVRAAATEDPTGFAAAFEALRIGSFADIVLAASAVIDDLVFTAPDHAWVRYDIIVNEGIYFDDRFGEAVLVDGQWKVANTTICRDIGLAGIDCPTQ